MTRSTIQFPIEGGFPSLGGATGWLNSPPLTAAALRGKVVLVDFGTYSCINWRRTLPYMRAWAEKYQDHGLVVIGVHTPEFGFERDLDNVRRATTALEIRYPVAVYGIADSPVGLAAYFLDHDAWSYALISRVFAGEAAGLTRDDILDNITIIWLTNTALSGARLYWENWGKLGSLNLSQFVGSRSGQNA